MSKLGSTTVLVLSLSLTCLGSAAESEQSLREGEASLRLEVYQGLHGTSVADPDLHLLIDVTPMLGPSEVPEADADLMPLAAQMAARLGPVIPGLQASATEAAEPADPTSAVPKLHPFHRLTDPAAALETCSSGGQEIYAQMALRRLIAELGDRDELRGARIVLASNLENECMPDLCAAAQQVMDARGWLDVVHLGEQEIPQCLFDLIPRGPEVMPGLAPLQPLPPRFRVERIPSRRGEGRAVVRGTAGESSVIVRAGVHMVIVELDREERIGPIQISAGQRLRIRLMDFPLSAPAERSWTVETQ